MNCWYYLKEWVMCPICCLHFMSGQSNSIYSRQVNILRCVIWYHLHNLSNVNNIHGGELLLVKLQARACIFTKSNSPTWVLFTFFKLCKCTKSRNTSQIFCWLNPCQTNALFPWSIKTSEKWRFCENLMGYKNWALATIWLIRASFANGLSWNYCSQKVSCKA